eukprot:4078201-Heterocapsa_arctica.AAC.1
MTSKANLEKSFPAKRRGCHVCACTGMAKASAMTFLLTVSTPMPTPGCNSILPLPRGGAQVIVLPPLPATI